MRKENNIDVFNKDVQSNKGYLYTTNGPLSSYLSTNHILEVLNKVVNIQDKTIVDVGCGDGTFTLKFLDSNPKSVLGIDAARNAILSARNKIGNKKHLNFEVGDATNLSSIKKHFDIAIVWGVLHHIYDVEAAVANICKIADEIIVIEPNGYNPLLKIIEKYSSYHIEHEEKSYPPHRLNKWFVQYGGVIVEKTYIGLVPYFCPNLVAKSVKILEPIIEHLFPINRISCGQYVMKINMTRDKVKKISSKI